MVGNGLPLHFDPLKGLNPFLFIPVIHPGFLMMFILC